MRKKYCLFICFMFLFAASILFNVIDCKAFYGLEDSSTERTDAGFKEISSQHGTAYNYLSGKQKELYDAMFICVSDYSKLMPKYNGYYGTEDMVKYSYRFYSDAVTNINDRYTNDDLGKAQIAFRNDFSEKIVTIEDAHFAILSGIENGNYVGYMVWCRPEMFSTENLSQLEAKTKTAISRIANLARTAGTSKAEQELYVHDYLINNIVYESKPDTYVDAYGGLVLGKTQCIGYAASFGAVMKELGIPCLQISGNAGLGGHQWNMVQLDNEWYEVDVTADDGDYEYDATHKHFNRTTADFKNKNDTYMSYDRDDYGLSYKYPEATGTKYTYDYIVPERNDDGSIGITSVKFNNFSYEQRVYLHVGDTLDVSCTTTPDNATNKELIIYSSDTSVATISGNTLTAVGIGGAGITAYPVNQNEHVKDAHDWFEVFVVADDVDISGSNNSGTSSSSSQSSSSSSNSSDSSSSSQSSSTTTVTKQEAIDKSVPTPKKLSAKATKKTATISWKKQTKNTTGYEIQYATDKKFTKDVKIVSAKKSATSKTIKKLKPKKTYYIRIRTKYKKNGKTVYSKWSRVKKVKIK